MLFSNFKVYFKRKFHFIYNLKIKNKSYQSSTFRIRIGHSSFDDIKNIYLIIKRLFENLKKENIMLFLKEEYYKEKLVTLLCISLDYQIKAEIRSISFKILLNIINSIIKEEKNNFIENEPELLNLFIYSIDYSKLENKKKVSNLSQHKLSEISNLSNALDPQDDKSLEWVKIIKESSNIHISDEILITVK